MDCIETDNLVSVRVGHAIQPIQQVLLGKHRSIFVSRMDVLLSNPEVNFCKFIVSP